MTIDTPSSRYCICDRFICRQLMSNSSIGILPKYPNSEILWSQKLIYFPHALIQLRYTTAGVTPESGGVHLYVKYKSDHLHVEIQSLGMEYDGIIAQLATSQVTCKATRMIYGPTLLFTYLDFSKCGPRPEFGSLNIILWSLNIIFNNEVFLLVCRHCRCINAAPMRPPTWRAYPRHVRIL